MECIRVQSWAVLRGRVTLCLCADHRPARERCRRSLSLTPPLDRKLEAIAPHGLAACTRPPFPTASDRALLFSSNISAALSLPIVVI